MCHPCRGFFSFLEPSSFPPLPFHFVQRERGGLRYGVPPGLPIKQNLSTPRIFCALAIFGGGGRRNLRFEMSEDWRLHVELVEFFGDAEVHDN